MKWITLLVALAACPALAAAVVGGDTSSRLGVDPGDSSTRLGKESGDSSTRLSTGRVSSDTEIDEENNTPAPPRTTRDVRPNNPNLNDSDVRLNTEGRITTGNTGTPRPDLLDNRPRDEE